MHGIKLYMRFIGVYLKTKIEYDHIFVFMDLVLNSIWPIVNMTLLWFMLDRFGNIAGWGFYQLLFLFTLSFVPYMISSMFIWNPTRELQELVRTGAFDAYMTRPLNPLIHLIMRQFSHGHFFGLFLSVGMLIYSVKQMELPVNFWSVLGLLSIIIGGALIYGAVMLFCGSLSFWFIKTESIYQFATNDVRSMVEYPLPIYNKVVQTILTFVVPYGFVNYIPSQGIQFPDDALWSPMLQWISTPLLGLTLFVLSCLFFKFGMRRYQSTGS
jgi:ABC-2 type transport system permease protein